MACTCEGVSSTIYTLIRAGQVFWAVLNPTIHDSLSLYRSSLFMFDSHAQIHMMRLCYTLKTQLLCIQVFQR